MGVPFTEPEVGGIVAPIVGREGAPLVSLTRGPTLGDLKEPNGLSHNSGDQNQVSAVSAPSETCGGRTPPSPLSAPHAVPSILGPGPMSVSASGVTRPSPSVLCPNLPLLLDAHF